MKKIVIASLSAAVAGPVFAGGSWAAGANSVTTANCTLLSTAATVNLSTGNVGYYDCNSSSASIGVAVAATAGKNKVYSAGSAGGGITETTLSAAPTSSNAQTQAQAKAASS